MTTKSKPWDHLPNAAHIDRIIASWNQHRDIWNSAWGNLGNFVSYDLDVQSYHEAKVKCREVGRWGIWAEDDTPRIDAILALIAYDDCAHYLDMPSQELTTIALLGVTPAILLLRAVLAFEALKNSSVVTEYFNVIMHI